MRLLSNLFRRFISQGTLRVRDAEGKVHVFGERLPGPDVSIHLHDRKLYTKLFINPELYAAEAYMDGTLTLEDGAAIQDFLLLFSVNRAGLYSYGSQKLMQRVWRGLPPLASGQSDRACRCACPPPLRHLDRTLPSVPRRSDAIFLRLFSRPRA